MHARERLSNTSTSSGVIAELWRRSAVGRMRRVSEVENRRIAGVIDDGPEAPEELPGTVEGRDDDNGLFFPRRARLRLEELRWRS